MIEIFYWFQYTQNNKKNLQVLVMDFTTHFTLLSIKKSQMGPALCNFSLKIELSYLLCRNFRHKVSLLKHWKVDQTSFLKQFYYKLADVLWKFHEWIFYWMLYWQCHWALKNIDLFNWSYSIIQLFCIKVRF